MAEQDPDPGDTSPAAPSWTVREVQGRRSSSGKGLAAVHSMTMQNEDGTEFVIQRVDAHGAQVEMHIVGFAKPTRFDRCPICLEPDPMSKEHVPPEAIGGSVMTSTCYRCNNQAGSVWEPELVNWWEDAIGSVSFSHDEIPGRRKTSSVLIRQNGDTGEPVLVLSGRMDPAIVSKMKAGGVVEMTYSPPDRNRYRLAALKSAYLAACLLTGSIPETPEAKAIRAELIAARDLPRRQRPEISSLCANLQIHKTQGPAVPGEIALVQTLPSDGSNSEFAISLARSLMVQWPIGGYLVGEDAQGNPIDVRAL